MWLWVGLGNPGKKYQNTRHNAGAILLYRLLEQNGKNVLLKFDKKLNAEICKFSIQNNEKKEEHICIFPLTYMNLSGDAVSKALQSFHIEPQNMVVLHDELELPPLSLKYKMGGGHRGHNGLRDIIQKTKSADFHRIRIGIGRPASSEYSVADYVLSKMPVQDLPHTEELSDLLHHHRLPCFL